MSKNRGEDAWRVEEISPPPLPPGDLAATERADREFEAKRRRPYVPKWPLWATRFLVGVGATLALPLVQAMHRRLTMSRAKQTLVRLDASLWGAAGNPTQRGRRTILAHLRKLPGLVLIKQKRTPFNHYMLAKGPLWDNPPPEPLSDDDPDECP
jgi:hypothetical protein